MSRRGNPGITIRLTQDQIDRLKAIATMNGQSLSDLVRDAIQMLLLHKKFGLQKSTHTSEVQGDSR